jgi:hypothetical protein
MVSQVAPAQEPTSDMLALEVGQWPLASQLQLLRTLLQMQE